MGYRDIGVSALLGKTLTRVYDSDDEVSFETSDGFEYLMKHYQDCCESVYVDDIEGDLEDLVGSPILDAREECNDEDEDDLPGKSEYDSYTWTFYKLATIKGSVTIKWYGSSNGYYSESVDFVQIRPVVN